MRILMAGPNRALAMWRPITWAVQHGHTVWVVEESQGALHSSSLAANQSLAVPIAPLEVTATNPASRTAEPTRQVQALADDFQPDLIHAHYLTAASVWCTDAGRHPLIVSAWGALNALLAETGPASLSATTRRTLHTADAVIVESPALVTACRPLISPSARVELIPLGADMQRFRPDLTAARVGWRKALRIPDAAVALLSPRGWGRLYHHEQIVEAVALARPRLHRPVVLLFTKLGRSGASGEAEACIAQMEQQAAALGITELLRWTPPVAYELMPSLYALADVVINYPAVDAFPSTLVEAAACARPIVTAQLPGYRDTFVEEYCTLVPPQQPAALADALVEVVNQPPTARAARLHAARQFVAAHHDEAIARARLMQLYAEMAAHA